MGKKVKKTKWRTLEIPAPGKYTENGGSKWDDKRRTPSTNNNSYHQYEGANIRRKSSPCPSPTAKASDLYSNTEGTKGNVEDEYTKITTPRQDVLFKKGYLTRRKVPETISENSADQNNDGIAQDCSNNEDLSNYANGDESVQFMCPGPQSFIDPSALYYGGGYEIYDPYTGNVTVIVGPGAGQYPTNSSCQPMLTSLPCRPVPLQPVQWFNPVPSPDWCPYSSNSDKRYSTDSQGASGVSSESSGVPESPPEMTDEMNGSNGPIFSPSYVYPGYMFGAPIYNVDDVNTQYYAPNSPTLSSSELTTSKRRRKKKRRRRAQEAEEESESSFDDNCSRSISSSEFILDSHLEIESQHDFEELYASNESHTEAVPFPSFPHPNVNAPEFVPTGELSLTNKKSCDEDVRSSNSVLSCPDELLTQKALPLNVYCGKPFEDSESKHHDTESVSCSNNSDSGISSPGSEDISKSAFSEKEGKGVVDETKKKPRSRKSGSKAKNKSSSATTSKKSNEIDQSFVIPVRKEKKIKEKNEKAESKKAGKSVSKKGTRSNSSKEKRIESVIPAASNKAEATKKADKKKNTKNAKKLESADVVTECNKDDYEEDSFSSEVHLACTENLNVLLGQGPEESDNKISTTGEERCCEFYEGRESRTSSENSSSGEDTTRTMLNEYVKIEEKPVLAKLVDLDELEEKSQLLMEEISSTSEFSSCREKRSEEKSRQQDVELAAKEVVNEIIDRAEERVLSSMSCDKLQLPITEAVTKWLNEHGGLSVVEKTYESESDCEDTEEKLADTIKVEKKSKRLKQNCVIC